MSRHEFKARLSESMMNVRMDTSNMIGWSAPIKNQLGQVVGKSTIVDAGGNCEIEIEQGSQWMPTGLGDYMPPERPRIN